MKQERVRALLSRIYGSEMGGAVCSELDPVVESYRKRIPSPRASGLSERDAILITYADQVQAPGKAGLESLDEFCDRHLKGSVSGIHVLPFYPWSSDDGFSVIDYEAVAPQYGTWEDIQRLGQHFRLMFDAVVNHTSAQSRWFKGFLRDKRQFKDFFIEVSGDPDLSAVVRPRALPLLTEFGGKRPRKLWTTFSADQIDLNYHNPRVLLKIMEVLLFYASQGAELIRLDAIAYLWKEPGTPCINLPQTHGIVQLMRAVLDEVAPHVLLITETNLPNLENLSYFGDGSNEAQLVYNFPLPPLVLHALQTGSAFRLSHWAASLRLPGSQATFLNFLASHDGIGLNPVRGLLRESELEGLVRRVEAGGGFVSAKTNADGTQSPYELNINYFDALNCASFRVGPELQIERFTTAHAILLAFTGVPAIYFHSLFGSQGWPEGVTLSGKNRSINRQKLQSAELERQLTDGDSLRAKIFRRISHLLSIRRQQACFSPQAAQRVLEGTESVFALLREDAASRKAILCVHNVTREDTSIRLDISGSGLEAFPELQDVITGRRVPADNPLTLRLRPYETVWLTA